MEYLRIHEALMRSNKLSQSTIDELFTRRTELIPIARNPFAATLIRLFAESNGGQLPRSQLEMYQSYTRQRLLNSMKQISDVALSADQLTRYCTEIAWCMFQTPDIGLEASVSRLSQLLVNIPVEVVVSILRHAGLARLSPPPNARVSFVHRRLNEYFVARKFLADPSAVSLQAIPTDSRFRDALVLYCEVGDETRVKKIADYCWTQVDLDRGVKVDAEQNLRSVHCLRFLRDAFRARPQCTTFGTNLREYILTRLRPSSDILAAKLSLEATGLLSEEATEPIIEGALKLNNPWISATAVRACRNLKRIGPRLQLGLQEYFESMDIREFLARYREIMFSLALSDAFSPLRRYCLWRAWYSRLSIVACLLSVILAPVFALCLAIGYALVAVGLRRSKQLIFFARTELGVGLLLDATLRSRWLSPIRTQMEAQFHDIFHFTPVSLSGTGRLFPLNVDWITLPGVSLTHGLVQTCAIVVYIFIGLAITPWLDWALLGTRWRALISREAIVPFVSALILVTATAALAHYYPRVGLFVGYCFVIAAGLSAIGITIVELRRHITDRRVMLRVTGATSLNRATIAADFARFRTGWYRVRYVSWLRAAGVRPEGEWPSQRPQIRDGAASTMLAQLDSAG